MGNIVILVHDKYRSMYDKLLQDKNCYCVLDSDPTDGFKAELKQILSDAKALKVINATEFEFLLPTFPRISTFYALPKVHKGLHPLKGRPIVENLCQNSGIYIDNILKPFVEALPSFVQDMTDLLKRLEGEPSALLLRIDLESLYSSIPHTWDLKAVKHVLSTRGTQYHTYSQFVLRLLEFTLTRNLFLFNGKFHHQLRETAAPVRQAMPISSWVGGRLPLYAGTNNTP